MPTTASSTDSEQTPLSPAPTEVKSRYVIPLSVIMLVALIMRGLAAFFSAGFAFHDDHFDVIEIAQAWVYGLPVWLHEALPPRHSMFYTGLHYLLFQFCDHAGLTSPDHKMTVVRLLHGLYSLLIVYFGYKITEQLSNQRNARLVGLMLALMWFMPFMSVRNLVEMVCIPPYLAAFYLLTKPDSRPTDRRYFWVGALFALAFVFRYHTVLLVAGAGLVLLYRRQWREILLLALGFLGVATLIQGTIDAIFFDYPFHSVVTYFLYNSANAYNYSTGPVYRYLLTVLGFLVPPLSVYLLVGYARTAKTAPMLFLGGLFFFGAHSLFPNKQERFILPLLPLIIVLGVIGWQSFVQQSRFWQTRRKLLAASWTFFWVLNITVAVLLAFTYTKKSRIAPLVYLSGKSHLPGILLEFGDHSAKLPPLFYLGRLAAEAEPFAADPKKMWGRYKTGTPLPPDFVMVYHLNDKKNLTQLKAEVKPNYAPNYLILVGQDEIARRLQRIHQLYPNLNLERIIAPSLYDQVLHRLNPRVHKDEHVRIYRIL